MFETVFPMLSALVLAHGWMTLMLVHTLSDGEVFSLPPETFPI